MSAAILFDQDALRGGAMTDLQRVTACLIVQDEESRLRDALRSLTFCDDVVVVDGGSRDRTVAVAREAGARVIENPWPGYARQRNVALGAASTEWVWEIDADERVSQRLADSVRAFLADPPADVDVGACAIRNRFMGRMLGPSAKYPQYRFRLFRRAGRLHDERLPVHEGLPASRGTVVLDGELVHELAGSLGEAARDVWRYAQLQAPYVSKPRSVLQYPIGIAVRPATKLLYRLVLEGGWRDGWRGTLKIGLDCASDALVWVLVLRRRTHDAVATSDGHRPDRRRGAPVSGHFGVAWGEQQRPVKIVAVAGGVTATRRAAHWLAAVKCDGAEVALVTDQPAGELGGVRLRHTSHLGPLEILRALEAERQLMPADALVAVGGLRARLFSRLMPRVLRGTVDGLDISQSTAEAVSVCARASAPERGDIQQRAATA
jgi:Glycosyl transferase family 2